MILARRGFRVSVFEARDRVGGRNAAIELGPYVFDTGPTFLMLRAILDEVFQEGGTSSGAELTLTDLDPMYRLVFGDRLMNVTADHERMKDEVARVFPGRGDRLAGFLEREKRRFERLFPCLQKSYHRASTMVSRDMRRALPHMALGRTLFSMMHEAFGEEKLALCFTFQSKYLGMSPWDCPGIFSMIPYIEHAYGIQHVRGGLSRISDAMADVARRHGAEIVCGRPVRRILTRNRSAVGVELADGEHVEADEVVINADLGHAATTLFEPGFLRKYTPARLGRMKVSCSTFMLYLGLDTVYDMPHHAIYFADDYRKNVETIFRGGRSGDDISFYVRNSSKTDPDVAPPGHSAVYVLVPAPNVRSGLNWEADTAAFRENVLSKLETRAGMGDIRRHIRRELVITPSDWEREYRVYAGATFNLAHNIGQMLYFRPHNKFEEADHCYLVGGGTHPGSGLPTIYESGRITANLISRKHNVVFVSGNLEV